MCELGLACGERRGGAGGWERGGRVHDPWSMVHAPACVGVPKVRKPMHTKQPKAERKEGHDEQPKPEGDEELDEPADKKRSTPTALYKEIADATELEMKSVKMVFHALSELVATKLRKDGKVIIPGIVQLRLKDTPGRTAGMKTLFNKEVPIATKPPGKRVHPLVLKPLKLAVNETSDSLNA